MNRLTAPDWTNRSISSTHEAWEFMKDPVSLQGTQLHQNQHVMPRMRSMLVRHIDHRVAAYAYWVLLAGTLAQGTTFAAGSPQTTYVGETLGKIRTFVPTKQGTRRIEEIKWTAAHSSPLPELDITEPHTVRSPFTGQRLPAATTSHSVCVPEPVDRLDHLLDDGGSPVSRARCLEELALVNQREKTPQAAIASYVFQVRQRLTQLKENSRSDLRTAIIDCYLEKLERASATYSHYPFSGEEISRIRVRVSFETVIQALMNEQVDPAHLRGLNQFDPGLVYEMTLMWLIAGRAPEKREQSLKIWPHAVSGETLNAYCTAYKESYAQSQLLLFDRVRSLCKHYREHGDGSVWSNLPKKLQVFLTRHVPTGEVDSDETKCQNAALWCCGQLQRDDLSMADLNQTFDILFPLLSPYWRQRAEGQLNIFKQQILPQLKPHTNRLLNILQPNRSSHES